MCKFFYLRYTCGHCTPNFYDATHKLYVKTCASPRRRAYCRIRSGYTNLDSDCADCESEQRRRIRQARKEAERIWALSNAGVTAHQSAEQWLGKPRFPYVIPRIVIHRVPDVAPEPAPRAQKGFLAAPPKAFSLVQRQQQCVAWGGSLHRVVLNLEDILCLVAPEFVRAAALAAMVEAQAEAEALLLARTTRASSEGESVLVSMSPPSDDRSDFIRLSNSFPDESILLSLPGNGKSRQREKRGSWRRRVQARIWRKLDRFRSLLNKRQTVDF